MSWFFPGVFNRFQLIPEPTLTSYSGTITRVGVIEQAHAGALLKPVVAMVTVIVELIEPSPGKKH